MQKEIFEQPESVVNTMRGRIFFDTNTGDVTACSALYRLRICSNPEVNICSIHEGHRICIFRILLIVF